MFHFNLWFFSSEEFHRINNLIRKSLNKPTLFGQGRRNEINSMIDYSQGYFRHQLSRKIQLKSFITPAPEHIQRHRTDTKWN